jgi:chemotaxis protein methyltransferase CheR
MQTLLQTLSDPLMLQISGRIEDRTGLHFPSARFADLRRGLAQASRDSGYPDPHAYAESLLNRELSDADIEVLAGTLTIGETHFFRDERAFEFLESTLLPGLLAAKRGGERSLRIWSAGCATGEEPYSMAILLHRLIPDLKDWHVSILGTDINPKALVRAEAGIYTEWSFRDTASWVKPRYFITHPDGRYEIQPWLKRMVNFACLNLAEDVYPSIFNHTNGLDLIICRNVLLYFAPSRIAQVVRRFHRALVEGGYLVMGAVEACQIEFPAFTSVPAPSVALYLKNEGKLPQSSDGLDGGTMINGFREPPAIASPEAHSPAEWVTTPPTDLPGVSAAADDLHVAGVHVDASAKLPATGRLQCTDFQSAAQRVQHHANLGELAEALFWCERAIANARTDVPLHFLQASILQELHRDEDALVALRNVLFLDPGHVLAHFTLANLYRRRNRKPDAAKHLANLRQLLSQRDQREELPQSGGLTVGRLNAILPTLLEFADVKNGAPHE